jgi:hypothetical protein
MKLRIVLALALTSGIGAVGQPEDSFSVILIPDTQFYTLKDPATYRAQTKWIVDNIGELNTKAAIHLGDVTDQNDVEEWSEASEAHRTLDNSGLPYSVTTGNHDYEKISGERRSRVAERFNATFPHSRFGSWYGGHFGPGTETNYILFNGAGRDFMVMSLEYAPPKDAMCWANRMLRANPTRRAIVATHCYLNRDGTYNDSCDTDPDRNVVGGDGRAVWNEVVRQNPNVFLVVTGHRNGAKHTIRSRETGLTATAATVDTVHELLTDYQGQKGLKADPVVSDDHGNGWLAILQFSRSARRVNVRTHSVLGATTLDPNPTWYQPDATLGFDYNFNSAAPPGPAANPIAPTDIRFADRVVNAVSSGHQRSPRVASDAAGNWVSVWDDDRNNNEKEQVRVRGFDSMGCERFPEVIVNTKSEGRQHASAVASDRNGRFVVVWQDDGGDDKYQIKMRGFNADGSQRFSQRTVNEVDDGQQVAPAIGMSADGSFVVTWQDDIQNDGKWQIKARRFTAEGTPIGGQFVVNTVDDGQQKRPAIGMNRAGEFVIAWEDDQGNDGKYQVKARGFRANGTQRFAQKTINADDTGQQLKPSVAVAPDASFVVTWEDSGNDQTYQIKMRGFAASGAQAFSQRTVNDGDDGNQLRPSISMAPYDESASSGQFVITWEDDFNNNDTYQVKARGFSSGGGQRMPQVTINRHSNGEQIRPAVTLTRDGRFVVVWQDDLENNDYWEILARGCTLTARCEWPQITP